MNGTSKKPKLVFFQFKYDPRLPAFLSLHAQEHAKCLSYFFDVTVIDQDCDYLEVCDRHVPELVMFETGVPFASCRRPNIRNVKSNQSIPKLALLNADPFGEGRAGFMADIDRWGIETIFSIATTATQHLPELAKHLFIWPNFIDPEVYHDYGQEKTVPVLFTGNKNGLYPWRQSISRIVSNQFSSVISAHPGYSPLRGKKQPATGEAYARMLNSAFFVPACGSVTKEVVRKHFEVPGSHSCLVTQRSEALEAAGFRDMVNCVFAEENDVLEKLSFLFENPEQLQAITSRGYELVHSQHSMRYRDQVFQWFSLRKNLAAGKKIVQPNPFGKLEVVNAGDDLENKALAITEGSLMWLLEQGDRDLNSGRYETAEAEYLKCLSHYRWMPEAQLKLAICKLHQGDAKAALAWITKPIHFTLAEYKSPEPDPVEWAYFIIALLCLGKTKEAFKRARQFSLLQHPELDRARVLAQRISSGQVTQTPEKSFRRSIHRLPEQSFSQWLQQVESMLVACGQAELARKTPETASAVPVMTKNDSSKKIGIFGDAAREFRRKYALQQIRETVKRPLRKMVRRARTKYEEVVPGFLTQIVFRGQQ